MDAYTMTCPRKIHITQLAILTNMNVRACACGACACVCGCGLRWVELLVRQQKWQKEHMSEELCLTSIGSYMRVQVYARVRLCEDRLACMKQRCAKTRSIAFTQKQGCPLAHVRDCVCASVSVSIFRPLSPSVLCLLSPSLSVCPSL